MRSSRFWDVPAVLLLLAALLIASARLLATQWVDHLGLVQMCLVLGLATGLALGYSIFSPALAAVFAVLYGVFVVPWQLIVNVAYIGEDVLWSDRVVVLFNRLAYAMEQFVNQQPVRDPVLFLFAMAALTWVLSVHAGYSLTRRGEPWRIILPTGAGVLLIHTSDIYRDSGIWYLVAYVLLSLLLLARLTFLQLCHRWEEEGTRVPPLAGLDISYAIVVVAVIVVLLAWTVPAMADVLPAARRVWDRATGPWEERLDNLFASLDRLGPTRGARYYGAELSLGSGSELSDTLVASVQVPSDGESYPRYYWRATVYDQYADGGWTTAAFASTQSLHPSSLDFSLPELEGRRPVTFTFTSYEPMATLFVAPQPLWASRPVEVSLAENPDGTVDVASLRASPFVNAGGTYSVRSSVAAVTIAELRAAGTDYPEWVTDRYLQLPESITPRTRELARQIGGDWETPYDKVAAVTRYLRENIRYSEIITATVPTDRELLDWFLFDHQAGFCNYYASAQVVLLRELGIPARLAIGFGAGQRQQGTNTYLVYERNAHAWPEVYFPGLGWVEFEPTVSEDPIARPRGETESPDDGSLRVPPERDPDDLWPEGLAELNGFDEMPPAGRAPAPPPTLGERMGSPYGILGLLAGLVLVVVLVRRRRRRRTTLPFPVQLERGLRRIGLAPPPLVRRWAKQALLSPLEHAYMEVDRALARLGAASRPADTPAERAAALRRTLPEASGAATLLLGEYQAATYGPHRHNIYAAREAAHTIRRLSWLTKLRRFVGLA